MKIKLPNSNNSGAQEIELKNNLVVVGANGSGKSRFGSYIEQKSGDRVKRISAQRMLRLVNNVPKLNIEEAFQQMISSHRHQPVTVEQNDYQQVLTALFAETSKRDSDYVKASKESDLNIKLPIPDSAIDKLIVIWNKVFPHRTVILDHGRVEVEAKDSTRYAGSEMSDGEKIALYLMAQCIILPPYYLIIIDEPELHLHESLMSSLWDAIEEVCYGCMFIYITHDLNFASSRFDANKIWIKDFHNDIWDWCYLPQEAGLPEDLLLKIIGSKRPKLLIEGEKNSLDVALYQIFYNDFIVIPRGSCQKVIESVRGLRSNFDLHPFEVYGLIDRDNRSAQEIEFLKTQGIYVLDFSEIENIFLLPEFIEALADQMLVENKTELLLNIMKTVSLQFKNDINHLALEKTICDVVYMLSQVAVAKSNNIEHFIDNLKLMISDSEIKLKFESKKSELEKLICSEEYLEILKEYNNKGLCSHVSHHFGLATKGKTYQKKIIQMLKRNKKNDLIAVLKKYLPEMGKNS